MPNRRPSFIAMALDYFAFFPSKKAHLRPDWQSRAILSV
jgi:hypothetical protein